MPYGPALDLGKPAKVHCLPPGVNGVYRSVVRIIVDGKVMGEGIAELSYKVRLPEHPM